MNNIFKIKKEEIVPSLTALGVFIALNAMFFYKYCGLFLKAHHVSYWQLFAKTFHVSGFDAWSLIFLSNGKIYFEIPRHPLFAVILYPFYLVNKHLIADGGEPNFAMIFMAVLLIVGAFYSFVFMYRIFREIIGMNKKDTCLLTAMLYSFGMVMTSVIVPDHFCWSLCLLSLTLLLAGRAIKEHRPMKAWVVATLAFFTGGVTLSNIAKTGLASWFANGKKVFSPKNMAALVVPFLLLIGTAYGIYTEVKVPQLAADKRIEVQTYAKDRERQKNDSIHHAWVLAHMGDPVKKEGFLKWTDTTTSRTDALIHNMMGESVQLHDSYLLEDMSVNRPTIVKYKYAINYIAEGIISLLFVLGIIVGIRHRHKFFLLVMSWLAFDLFLHFGLGFGLNEMYIMSCHWIFAIPIALAYLLKHTPERHQCWLRLTYLGLSLFLWIWNGWLFFSYMSEQATTIMKS